MLKPLMGSVGLTLLSAHALGADEASQDISTWRWRVSQILEAAKYEPVRFARADFDQRYERYSVTGMPDATGQPPR